MSDADERNALVEAALTAFRERDPRGRILPSPAWMDLAPDDREAAFDIQSAERRLETAYDDARLNSTVRVVTERAKRMPQL